MLPDFPKLKADVSRLLFAYLHARIADQARFMPPRRMTFHEGKRMRMVRESGEVEVDNLKRIHAEMVLGHAEINNLSVDTVVRELNKLAESIAHQQVRIAFQVIERGARAVGNEISLHGRPLTARAIIRMLRTVQVEFRPDGSPDLPTLVGPPSQAARMEEINRQFQSDPRLQREFRRVIEQKRSEWLDRETSRTLAG